MLNRVGDVVPTEQQVESLVEDVVAIQKRIEKFTVSLTREERVSSAKMRTGGEGVVGAVGQLAEEHEIALPQITVQGMTADLTLAQRLRPLAEAARQLSQRVDDTILTAQSECWWSATAFYTTLARVAAVSPTLQEALRPIVDFFAQGPRKKAPPATPSPSTPTTPTKSGS